MTGAVDVQILNRLLEHRNFPKMIDLIRIYFQDTAAKGITARNQFIEIATASLSDLMKEHPEHRTDARQDLQLLNAQKMGEHEAEIEKIKNVFLAILRDIKKDIDNGEKFRTDVALREKSSDSIFSDKLRFIYLSLPFFDKSPVNSFEFQPCGRTPQAGYLLR